LGFPTANLRIAECVVPRNGVYISKTTINDETFRSVSNLGTSPTFGTDNLIKLETHILEFEADLYSKTLRVEFLKFLRDEMAFSSALELAAQIQRDIRLAATYKERVQ